MGTKDSGACENLRCSRLKQTILIAAICAVYIVLCLYKIEQIPVGINIDEIGTQIDQYFLATNGTDRYGIQFPIYFINYGGGQNALNQYLCALTIKLLGYSFLQIKLPGIIVNVIGVTYLFRLLKDLINPKAGLIGAAIYTISPYGIMRARTVLESNLALPIMIVAIYYLYKAIIEDNDKIKQVYFLIAGAIHGIVLYAYIYEQLVYAIYLTQQAIYLTKHRKIKLKHSIIFAQQLLIVIQPLILFNIVNIFRLDTIEILGVTFKQLPYYRQGELVQGFTPFELLVQIICFLPSALYSDSLSYNQQLIGIYYPVSTLLVIVYTLKNWKRALNKEYNFKKIIMFLWLGNLVAQLMQIANCNKLSTSYIMFILLLCLQIENLKRTQLKRIVVASYITCFVGFFGWYYIFYNGSNEDFQVKPYNDILIENKIDYKNLMCTEQSQQVAYMRLRNGEKLQIEDFKIANENQQRQEKQEIKNCQYIVNKSESELIKKLDSLVNQGKAQSKEYKYHIFYTIYE